MRRIGHFETHRVGSEFERSFRGAGAPSSDGRNATRKRRSAPIGVMAGCRFGVQSEVAVFGELGAASRNDMNAFVRRKDSLEPKDQAPVSRGRTLIRKEEWTTAGDRVTCTVSGAGSSGASLRAGSQTEGNRSFVGQAPPRSPPAPSDDRQKRASLKRTVRRRFFRRGGFESREVNKSMPVLVEKGQALHPHQD